MSKEDLREQLERTLSSIDNAPPATRRRCIIAYIRRALSADAFLARYRKWLADETDRLQAEINAAGSDQAVKAAVLASRRKAAAKFQAIAKAEGLA